MMIDIYSAIAIGTTLGFGAIPLIKPLKTGNWNNLLVSYYVDKQELKEYLIQLKKDGDWIE